MNAKKLFFMVVNVKIIRFFLSPLFTAFLLFIFSLTMLVIQIIHGRGYLFVVYFLGMIAAGASLLFIRKRRVVKNAYPIDSHSSNIALIIQYVSAGLIYGCTLILNTDTKVIRDILDACGLAIMFITTSAFLLDLKKERGTMKPFFGATKNNTPRR